MRLLSLVLLLILSVIRSAIPLCGQAHSSPFAERCPAKSVTEIEFTDPSVYVIQKFKKYDYVFLGEHHRIKHDVNFVADLIPLLHDSGINNLAYEFCDMRVQDQIDSLLTARDWDWEKACRLASAGAYLTWGYKEYLHIYRVIWELNSKTETGGKKFRMICLGPPFDPCNPGGERSGTSDPDSLMAEVFIHQVAERNEKALIYCGTHHSFTRYHQPVYDFATKTLYRLNYGRMGNIIHNTYPGQVINIFLHSPWISVDGFDKPMVKPMNGMIDSLMSVNGDKPAAFDSKHLDNVTLRNTDTYYSLGYPGFKLSQFCDGYIFLKPLSQFQAVEADPLFYNQETTDRFRDFLKCQGWSDEKLRLLNPEMVVWLLNQDGNIQNRIKDIR